MTGEEMKALRQRTGLSQAVLASAIGMSRESIGRMERSNNAVERRTELALRYIALKGLPSERSLNTVHDEVARVLDDAAIRATPSIERTEKLKQAFEDWTAVGGDDAGRQLIHRAQGVIGLINVTDPRDGAWGQVMSDLSQVKRDWAAAKP
ncbi:helix-turn-helix domain-containing protein [Brevundimonas sp. NPDC046655]|uniref:helix-turn-helix domain-containing protein n=1 Tax=unclassified Brevundimonas TaxID=2622653 RepID=UPI0038502FAE